MTRTVALVLGMLASGVIVASAAVSLHAHVRALSEDLTALTREVTAIGEDVRSLADDLATLTDTLTEEDGDATGDETCPSDVDESTAGGI